MNPIQSRILSNFEFIINEEIILKLIRISTTVKQQTINIYIVFSHGALFDLLKNTITICIISLYVIESFSQIRECTFDQDHS